MKITARFQEEQHYDINLDREVVRFMVTTSLGSYWTETPVEGPRALRRDRERFRDMAVECIRNGLLPTYLDLPPMEVH